MSQAATLLGRIGLPASLKQLAARTWDVIIVGAGHTGLACAAYLRAQASVSWCLKRANASAGPVPSLAAAALQDLGLWRATDMTGGFRAWSEAGLPVVSSRERFPALVREL